VLACRWITEAYRRAAHGEGVEEVCVGARELMFVCGKAPHRPRSKVGHFLLWFQLFTFFVFLAHEQVR
jgi:hypothetical protein